MRPRSVVVAASLLAALASCPAFAAADALEPPPESCPEGAAGMTGRRGAYCGWVPCPASCPSDGHGDTLVCSPREVSACVRTDEFPAAEVQMGPQLRSLPAETRHVVVGPCGADGSCAVGRCEHARVCVPPTSASARGGLCAASPAGSPAPWLVLGLLALLRRVTPRRPTSRFH
jgi:uncharacterized protein (TIGR03382 family)